MNQGKYVFRKQGRIAAARKQAGFDVAVCFLFWQSFRQHRYGYRVGEGLKHRLICSKCQGTMTVVAIIEDPAELTKIIEWAKKQEQEPLLSVCARSPPELALVPV